ncbi:MAG: CDP-diacylglycerol--glycerol-3-phosphate 3-phosphatidyltransferase [Endomicrobiaceae bacterium]|nr:CDP-diacylglycerol--glycerol-3-phosphate 3-phosphatidyltransferase [Endomicrobiaceae bacterium]
MTIANKITIARIMLIPVFIVTYLQGFYLVALSIFTFTILTDAVDGFVARKYKQISKLGSLLDPIADKALMLSSFLVAIHLDLVPLWIFVVVVSRDVIILVGWLITYFVSGNSEVKTRFLGKITTIVQMVTMWTIVARIPTNITNILLILTVFVTAVSGIDYVIHGSRKLNNV